MALGLLFAGQGAQKVGMGKSLYAASPAAKALYDEARQVLGWDRAAISFEGPETELTQTKVCQPALFVHGLTLLAALREQGKLPAGEPKFALGLSLGEVTAYAAAGVFDFATGLKIVAERGRLMQQACEQSVGSMAAVVGEDRVKVQELCAEFKIEAANFNAPGQIIISGEKSAVEAAVADVLATLEVSAADTRTRPMSSPNSSATTCATLVFRPCPISVPPWLISTEPSV